MNGTPNSKDDPPFEKARNITAIFGLIVICGAMVMILWFGARSLSYNRVSDSPPAPTITIAFTSSITPALTESPTSTPHPTPTATHPPVWVESFAEPILSAIANLPPNVQDDFHDNSGGWHSDLFRENLLAPLKFIEGELVLNNCSAYRSKMMFKDLVLEVDGRFMEGIKGNPDWRLVFRAQGPADPQYAIRFKYDGSLTISMHDENFHHDNLQVNRGFQNNHILLIAKGSTFAVFVNGQPLYHWQYTKINQGGNTYFDAHTDNRWSSIIALDNLKIWDISDVP